MTINLRHIFILFVASQSPGMSLAYFQLEPDTSIVPVDSLNSPVPGTSDLRNDGPLPPDPKSQTTQNQGRAEQPPRLPVTPLSEPGLQNYFLSVGLSLFDMNEPSTKWQSGISSDVEIAGRFNRSPQQKTFPIFGSLRYRAADVSVTKNSRSYQGVHESFLIGAKWHRKFAPKLDVLTSFEAGLTTVHLHPLDGYDSTGDFDLVKTGVDLSLGTGVSYLLLEKLALGSRITAGVGKFTTFQLGISLSFLL